MNTKPLNLQALQHALLTAHEQNNYPDLIKYYAEAATLMENDGDIDAACYYLTQAYIYAMECGSEPHTTQLHNRLAKYGRVAQN